MTETEASAAATSTTLEAFEVRAEHISHGLADDVGTVDAVLVNPNLVLATIRLPALTSLLARLRKDKEDRNETSCGRRLQGSSFTSVTRPRRRPA
jgi:hypothetical protein